MSAIEARVRKLEQTPATATALLAQQARAKLDAGVPIQRLSDAELLAVWESIAADERDQVQALLASMTDAELDAFIAQLQAES